MTMIRTLALLAATFACASAVSVSARAETTANSREYRATVQNASMQKAQGAQRNDIARRYPRATNSSNGDGYYFN